MENPKDKDEYAKNERFQIPINRHGVKPQAYPERSKANPDRDSLPLRNDG